MKKRVQGSAALQHSSQFQCCQPLKASLCAMESSQPPTWANPCGKKRWFHSLQPQHTHPTPTLILRPIQGQGEPVTAASCGLKLNVMEVRHFS